MFTGIAHAAQTGPGAGGIGAFLPLIVLFAIFYFLLIRPQQKRAKEHQATLEALNAGDTVITNAGIYGTVIKIDGHVVTLQCSDKVRIKVIKKSISAKVDPSTMMGSDE
ncbi:MAG: preprotein translocase subunit YajC [bacterium]|nr:MAG: preprotein translocase subunit YajC [bacterium]